ncbi:centrosomal protein of 83 kDa-like [Venturia canescens]|uniref:centrosomal protein of 83 kDa-like n=1 Tax=Venturia canescens TaxID=32260 RepID=UPI001C9BD515|nr:centrosomal protein of 83 kDa-like [Venturia canescens]
MMHVCTNESEDDVLLNEYLRKLDELERSNEELRASGDDWEAELTRTRARIRERKEDAKNETNEMISKEREIGSSSWQCGKPLSMKRVQALMTRQLDRMRDIAKFRIRYTRLRNELVEVEVELKRGAISGPNLTKEDYERLEAEQFRYKLELQTMKNECVRFRDRRDNLIVRIKEMPEKMKGVDISLEKCEKMMILLKYSIKLQLQERKIWLAKLADAKHFVRNFNEIIGATERPEFATRITNIRKEHEEWMKKISSFLSDIRNLGQSLNSLRANLMLHGQELERVSRQIRDKSVFDSANERTSGGHVSRG